MLIPAVPHAQPNRRPPVRPPLASQRPYELRHDPVSAVLAGYTEHGVGVCFSGREIDAIAAEHALKQTGWPSLFVTPFLEAHANVRRTDLAGSRLQPATCGPCG